MKLSVLILQSLAWTLKKILKIYRCSVLYSLYEYLILQSYYKKL